VDFDIRGLILRLPVVLFSLTLHEFMHGWTASKCGDDTAQRAGRLTLNPLPHLDPIGTLCLMFAPIGWAKPVPVNPANYRHRRRDEILVSGAGVAANFGLAVALALVVRLLVWQGIWPTEGPAAVVWEMLIVGISINFALAVFNLLPIPPLDGSHILENLLPPAAAIRYAEMRRYGMYLLVGVVIANQYTHFLGWPILGLMRLATGLRFG